MRNFLVLYFSLFVFGWANAQSDTLNQKDANGRKNGYWIIYGKDKPNSGFADSSIIEEGKYEAGKKMGVWKTYYVSRIKKSEIEYKNNRPNGKFITYFENGQMKEEGMWKGTFMVGYYKKYWENGCIAQEKNFDKSGKTETFAYYYFSDTCGLRENECKRILDTINNKNFKGYTEECFSYNRKGEVTFVGAKSNNPTKRNESEEINFQFLECMCEVIVSDTIHTINTEKGKIVLQGEFKNKKIYNGKCTIYRKDSSFVQEYKVKEGKEYVELKKLITNDNLDKPKNGYYKTYDINKRITEDGEFKNDKLLNGKKYIYDKNGLLDKIEIYKNGKICR